jgi:hypothetical protein
MSEGRCFAARHWPRTERPSAANPTFGSFDSGRSAAFAQDDMPLLLRAPTFASRVGAASKQGSRERRTENGERRTAAKVAPDDSAERGTLDERGSVLRRASLATHGETECGESDLRESSRCPLGAEDQRSSAKVDDQKGNRRAGTLTGSRPLSRATSSIVSRLSSIAEPASPPSAARLPRSSPGSR